MLYKKLPEDKKSKGLARIMRRNATVQENHLWYDYLKKYPIRFLRQHTVGAYVLDFFCLKAKLAVEIDGSQHYDNEIKKYDEERTKYLNTFGIEVIRFTNIDISEKFEGVCITIDRKIKSLLVENTQQ